MIINKKALYLLKFVALSGMFSVLFGAWLAHSQSAYLPKALESLATAHRYQIYHTLALLFIVAMYKEYESKALLCSAASFILGILVFSGTIYLKVIFKVSALSSFTPIGGILLALGWFLLVFVGFKRK